MSDEQFALLIQKLDWIGSELERLNERALDTANYPTQVEIVGDRRDRR